MSELVGLMPKSEELAGLLRLNPSNEIAPLLDDVLLKPLGGLLASSGKRFRSQILEFAFQVADKGKTPPAIAADRCQKGSLIVEAIHAASMVVDDIEDQSTERRGQPTLHRQFGVPVALNAGNWLYFWPLERMKDWNLGERCELRTYRLCVEAIVHAHVGQALDVGVAIDTLPQEKVSEACLASLELKTGALMGLAASLGGALSDADDATMTLLRDFGCAFGISLQMFDDIGNLTAGSASKQYEDLRLRRPSWIWAVAAQSSSAEDFQEFKRLVQRLPDAAPFELWLDRQALPMRAKALAIENLNRAFDPLEERLEGNLAKWLTEIADRLRSAYV